MTPEIRKFHLADAERCREIIRDCFDKEICIDEKSPELDKQAREYVRNWFAAPGYLESKAKTYPIFVYELNGNIIALGALDENEIKKLYVDPDFHEQGIGTEMLSRLEEIAAEDGNKTVVLNAYANSVNFYKHRDYDEIHPEVFERDGVRMPTIKMKKELTHVIETDENNF